MLRVFAGALAEGGIVKALRLPNGARISNSRVKPKGDVSGKNSTPESGVDRQLIHVGHRLHWSFNLGRSASLAVYGEPLKFRLDRNWIAVCRGTPHFTATSPEASVRRVNARVERCMIVCYDFLPATAGFTGQSHVPWTDKESAWGKA